MNSKIVKVHPGRRTLAAVIDFLIAAFIGLGFFAATQAIFMKSAKGKELESTLWNYQIDSGLYADVEGKLTPYEEYNDYQKYEEIMTNYYLVWLPTQNTEIHYDNYWYNVHILGLNDAKGIYDAEDLASIKEPSNTGSALWRYQMEGDDTLYDEIGVPVDSLYEGGVLTPAGKAALRTFYCSGDDSRRSVYYNAIQNLFYQPFFVDVYNVYSAFNLLYPIMVAAPLAALIIFLVLPLIFKNGASLGKKVMHMCLVNRLGFTIKRAQVVLRTLPSILLGTILLVFLPLLWSVIVMTVILLTSYLLSIFETNRRALHDFLAGTMVVNEDESVIYDSAADQEAGEAAFEARMKAADELLAEGQRIIDREIREKAEIPDKKQEKTPESEASDDN